MTSIPDLAPVRLDGMRISLEPLAYEHYDALCAAGLDPDLWHATTIRMTSAADMREYLDRAMATAVARTAIPFTIRVREGGAVAGMTRLYNFVPDHRRIEIGFSWIVRPWQGTGINVEAKFLLLRHAFETLGCQRVEFKADADNERSRRALVKIGATEEGVLRHYMWSAHRGARDIRIFSIISAEWPALRGRLAPAQEDPT